MPDPIAPSTYWTVPLMGYKGIELDLAPGETSFSYHAVEQSGTAVLLSYFIPGGETRFAVADTGLKTIARLKVPFSIMADSIHLAPGGRFAVAQEDRYVPRFHEIETGKKLALLDAATGEVLRAWTRPNLAKHVFLTLTPTGSMVTYYGSDVRLVPTGRVFTNEPVVTIGGAPKVPFIYADR